MSGSVNWREPQVVCVGGVGGNFIIAYLYDDYRGLQLLAQLMCTSFAISAPAKRYVTAGNWHLGKREGVSEGGKDNR